MAKKNAIKKVDTANNNQGESDIPMGEDGPIFASEAAEQAMAEDPLFVFLKRHWQNLTWACVLVFIVLYGKTAFEDNKRSNLERGSEVYSRLELEYTALKGLEDKESEQYKESLGRLKGYTSALTDEYEPYKSIGSLYSGLLAIEEGNLETIKSLLNDYSQAELGSKSNLFGELALFSLSRALLDDEPSKQLAKESLLKLSSKGAYVNVAAAAVYKKVASTDKEKEDIQIIINTIIENQPEQKSVLEN